MQTKTNKRLKYKAKNKEKMERNDQKLLTSMKENEILLESVVNAGRNKYARRYKHSRVFATRQNLTSTAGYKCVRKSGTITLPHQKIVTGWQKAVSVEPGFNKEVLGR